MITLDSLLCCPFCRDPLERSEQLRCLACRREWPEVEGIPSFPSADSRWGEIPGEQMRALLVTSREKGSKEAAPRKATLHPMRADWFYLGNLQQRKSALDLGAGWGGLSLHLSKLFEEVVAVEPVWERAEFASRLLAEEGATNVRLIHADPGTLPLPRESFDLVMINGLLEEASFGGDEGDPEVVRRELLARALELLRPGGSLYLETGNRSARVSPANGEHRPGWRGILPRPVAACLRNLRRLPTHSAADCRRLLEGAGFEEIELHAIFPSQSHPRVLIPVFHPSLFSWAAKRSDDWRVEGRGLRARLSQRLAASASIARFACFRADAFAIWARRPAPRRSEQQWAWERAKREGKDLRRQVLDRIRAEWEELGLKGSPPSHLSVVQVAGNWGAGGQVDWFLFSDASPEPLLVAKVSRTPTRTGRISSEHQSLLHFQILGGALGHHVPRPVALWRIQGHLVSLQESVPGRAISRLAARGPAEMGVAATLEACAPFLLRLARETRRYLVSRNHPFLQSLLARGARLLQSAELPLEAQELLRQLIPLLREAQEMNLPLVAQHGDLNVFDVLASGEQFWVIDWEWSLLEGLPFLDLVTLAISAAETAMGTEAVWATTEALAGKHLGPYERVEKVARDYCAGLGLRQELRPGLVAAALFHSLAKEWEAGHAVNCHLGFSEENRWIVAAKALLASAPVDR